MSHQPQGSCRPARGFTIIEVLVALTILAIGMLGMGRLFIVTLQGNASATSRTVAVNLASDLADRIRANRLGTSSYGATSAAATGVAPTPACVGGTISFTVVCTPAQMAAYDLYQWDLAVRCVGATSTCWGASPTWSVVYAANPAGSGPNSYTITLNWVEQGTGQGLNYALTVQI
jgi:type IV pilus assembly protein PilV